MKWLSRLDLSKFSVVIMSYDESSAEHISRKYVDNKKQIIPCYSFITTYVELKFKTKKKLFKVGEEFYYLSYYIS